MHSGFLMWVGHRNSNFKKTKALDGRLLKMKNINVKKQQFIHNVNVDRSKAVKNHKKVILLSITLTFRRCDGG